MNKWKETDIFPIQRILEVLCRCYILISSFLECGLNTVASLKSLQNEKQEGKVIDSGET